MRCAILVCAVTLASCATSAPSADPLLRDYAGTVPGASVLVMRGDRVLLSKSYGLANLEENIASTPSTHYRLASVTKQFTAAAIVMLAERGALRYDDSIRRFLPSLPQWADAITIQHLLTHTSGLIDYEDLIAKDATQQVHDIDALHLLETQTSTYFAPGSKYQYSNTGYAFLALIVERVSGQSFPQFLQQNIFQPLGMKTTVAHVEGVDTVLNRAYGYSREGDHWRRTDQSLTSAVLGDGGIYTSIEDLTHWLKALDEGRFATASEPRVATDDPAIRYGFGWRISSHNGHRTVSHTGETRGFRNALVRFPDEHLAVVVLTNRSEGEPIHTALAIADLYLAP